MDGLTPVMAAGVSIDAGGGAWLFGSAQGGRSFGRFVGVGLALGLAPKAAGEIRDRVSASARRIGDDVKGRSADFRDQVADAVARGAHDVEQIAVAVKNDRCAI